jgi:transcriptional regulator
VPTWNYEVVHAHGTLLVRDDAKFVRGVVAKLTRQHEAGQSQPWKMGDAPADFLEEELGHIVGIEVRLTRLEGKRKLNQHHQQQDREGAIRGLEAAGNLELAKAMKDAVIQTA